MNLSSSQQNPASQLSFSGIVDGIEVGRQVGRTVIDLWSIDHTKASSMSFIQKLGYYAVLWQ